MLERQDFSKDARLSKLIKLIFLTIGGVFFLAFAYRFDACLIPGMWNSGCVIKLWIPLVGILILVWLIYFLGWKKTIVLVIITAVLGSIGIGVYEYLKNEKRKENPYYIKRN